MNCINFVVATKFYYCGYYPDFKEYHRFSLLKNEAYSTISSKEEIALNITKDESIL